MIGINELKIQRFKVVCGKKVKVCNRVRFECCITWKVQMSIWDYKIKGVYNGRETYFEAASYWLQCYANQTILVI